MPTTCQSVRPTLMVVPTSSPPNSWAAPTPAMTSFFPHSFIRPAMILMFPRTASAAGSTPRSGTFASVPVERLGKLIITYNSADESGPLVPRATPGASAMTWVISWLRPLTISLSAPLRKMMALSSEPEAVMAIWKPTAMERTATSTATTPAMPTMVAATEPRRRGTLISPKRGRGTTCKNHASGPVISHPSQSVRHAQAHGLEGGENSGGQTQRQADAQTCQQIIDRKIEKREQAVGGVPAQNDR